MPTSKDILKDAQKTYDENKFTSRAFDDTMKTAETDLGEFAKARALLNGSLRSMSSTVELYEDRLKDLNAGLGGLKKQEAVMAAPADRKVFDKLTKDFAADIKATMAAHKELSGMVKKVQGEMKR